VNAFGKPKFACGSVVSARKKIKLLAARAARRSAALLAWTMQLARSSPRLPDTTMEDIMQLNLRN
jgi:hypothetical protein